MSRKRNSGIDAAEKEKPMKLYAFSIRDSRGEVYNTPFFARAMGEAERNFEQLCNDEKSTVHAYPEDFSLYFIGEFDDQTGLMIPLKEPQHIVKAVNHVVRKKAAETAQLHQ